MGASNIKYSVCDYELSDTFYFTFYYRSKNIKTTFWPNENFPVTVTYTWGAAYVTDLQVEPQDPPNKPQFHGFHAAAVSAVNNYLQQHAPGSYSETFNILSNNICSSVCKSRQYGGTVTVSRPVKIDTTCGASTETPIGTISAGGVSVPLINQPLPCGGCYN